MCVCVQALESLGSVAGSGDSATEAEQACRAGICRCMLQLGDLRGARSMALQLNTLQLYKECALILEGWVMWSGMHVCVCVCFALPCVLHHQHQRLSQALASMGMYVSV